MLERLKLLEQAGQWAEIRQLGEDLLHGLKGDTLARTLLVFSAAYEHTATTSAEYRQALGFARAAVAAAEHGGLLHTWALARCASMAADVGLYAEAERAAGTFLKQLPAWPQAQVMEPFARLAIGKALSRRGYHTEATVHLRIGAACSTGEIQERIQLTLARALARGGRISAALATCPPSVQFVHEGKLHATCALILDRAHDWQGARLHARAALQYIASQDVCDVIETAELLLCLHRAAQHLGQYRQAATWLTKLTALLSPLAANIMATLQLESGTKGGACFDAAVCARGLPAGYERLGLLGSVG